jgi:type IV pilus assembly protein PilV
MKRTVNQSGVTLIEVLVSVLLMSIALLGMASLQATAVSQQSSSSSRSNAADLISDMTERLRASLPNAPGYKDGVTGTFTITDSWATQNSGTLATPSVDCLLNACNATQQAEYDLQSWRLKVRRAMPQGSALISGDIQNGVAITLMWYDKEFKQGADNELRTSDQCTAADAVAQRQVCCPAVAAAPVGVRCYNLTVLP